MVDRSRIYTTDDGTEYMVRVVPGSSGQWISTVSDLSKSEGPQYIGTYPTQQEALNAALTEIGWVDRSGQTHPTATTSFYGGSQGNVRVETRSQVIDGVRQYRASVIRQQTGSVLMRSEVTTSEAAALEEAMRWVLTDQITVRQFAFSPTTANPTQIRKIILDRVGETGKCRYTITTNADALLHESDTVFNNTMDCVIAAMRWIAVNS